MNNAPSKTAWVAIILTAALIICGRLFFNQLFDNDWAVTHWEYISVGYLAAVAALLPVALLILSRYGNVIGNFLDRRAATLVTVVGLLVLFYFLRFDSFVYGDGNLRVNQIGIAQNIIWRWFEIGSIFLVTALFKSLMLFDFIAGDTSEYRMRLTAGVNAWLIFSFLCTALSIIAALRISRQLAADGSHRLISLILILFGPHTMLFLGYTGIEVVVVTFTLWFAAAAISLCHRFTIVRLLMVWVITVSGVIFHLSLIYLLPAAIFVSLVAGSEAKHKEISAKAFWIAGLSCLAILAGFYFFSMRNFPLTQYLLFLNGKNPNIGYGIFSGRHLGDVALSLIFLFPQLIVLIGLSFKSHGIMRDKRFTTMLMLTGSGLVTFIILDPIYGIALDIVRLSAYLTPLALLLAVVVGRTARATGGRYSFGATLSAIVLFSTLSYLPAYTRIDVAGEYLTDYFEKNENFYLNGCHSFRDAYFFRGEFAKADEWEWKLPVESQAFLNFRGITNLIAANRSSEALPQLHRLVIRHPYWVEPRTQLAALYLMSGRPQQAKPHIDTCLMLQPFNKDHYSALYKFYRDTRDYPGALGAVEKALSLSPGNPDLLADLMTIQYHGGNLSEADSLADFLLASHPEIFFAYAMKGLVAERQNRLKPAAAYYRKFITLAPDDPDLPAIKSKLENLEAIINEEK